MGYDVVGAHRARSARGTAGFLASGGNTFRLLDEMQRRGWLPKVRARGAARRALRGLERGLEPRLPDHPHHQRHADRRAALAGGDGPACRSSSIRTTPSAVLSRHGGETRDQRIAEFLALNPGVKVLGLREGSLLRLEGRQLELKLGPGREAVPPDAKRTTSRPARTCHSCYEERCAWARNPLAIDYHDREWGVPVRDDRMLFEFLILEGAQAGPVLGHHPRQAGELPQGLRRFRSRESCSLHGEAKKALHEGCRHRAQPR